MAPYGACEVAQSTARSNAQFEVRSRAISKGISKEKEALPKVLSKEKEACSSNDLERSVASKHVSSSDFECAVASHEKEACSSTDFERSVAFRRSKKQARAVTSNAQLPKSKLEQ
jgi:hypothetical protein